MSKIVLDKLDLIFFIDLGCSIPELAEVFGCSERTIMRNKKYHGLSKQRNNTIVDGKKYCTGCETLISLSEFGKDSRTSIGYRSKCKKCLAKENSEYYKTNKPSYRRRDSIRRASMKRAVPSWYSELDDFVLEEMYEICTLRGEKLGFSYEIDHIIPLQSNIVCGLHWHKNWQILTRTENRSKSNKLIT